MLCEVSESILRKNLSMYAKTMQYKIKLKLLSFKNLP